MYRPVIFVAILLISVLLVPHYSPALAQTETETPTPTMTSTPTITPTPATRSEVPLTSGSVLVVERTVTYGDIAVTLAVGVLIVVFTITHLVEIADRWLA